MKKDYSALYYPSIEFANPSWLWTASLIWDRIYRIVPRGYIPQDADNVKQLCESGEIGAPIEPDNYCELVSDDFIQGLQTHRWNAAALHFDMREEYARLHRDKVDVRLREIIVAQGKSDSGKEWLSVPKSFEAHYMTFLARYVAERNSLNLVTDVSPAWTATTFFAYDGAVEDCVIDEFPNLLAALVIRDFVPMNITSITPRDLVKFRERRRDERHRFIQAVRTAAVKFANCHEPSVVRDTYEDVKKDITSSMEEYKSSMDMLKVKSWTGLKTITFPAATAVIAAIMPLDPMQLSVISAAGVAMGAVASMATFQHEQKKLTKEHEYSYLVNVNRNWKNCSVGNGDLNYFLYRQMEEFLND